MNASKFSTNSWHFQLVQRYCPNPQWHYDDICSYSRRVLIQALKMLALFSIAWLAFFVFWDTVVYYAIGLIFAGAWGGYIPNWPAVIGSLTIIAIGIIIAIIGVIMLIIFSCAALKKMWGMVSDHVEPIKTPTFLDEAWRSFHDKTCFKIEFMNKDQELLPLPKKLDELEDLDTL